MAGIQTSRGQAAADGSIEAGLADARIGVKNTTQLDLAEPGYLSVTAPLVLEGQLIAVQGQRAQAALEAVLSPRRAPPSTLTDSWPFFCLFRSRTVRFSLATQWPHLGPEEKRGIWSQRPKTDRGSGCSAALHVAVIQ